MCTGRLVARVKSVVFVDIGYVVNRKLTFDKVSIDGSGKCDIQLTNNPDDAVYGVVFSIPCSGRDALDKIEGVGNGYSAGEVSVVTASRVILASLYFATNTNATLRPYDWYKNYVVSGAIEHGLPEAYIARLKEVESIPDPNFKRAKLEAARLFDVECRKL
jgi:hypothetical protein